MPRSHQELFEAAISDIPRSEERYAPRVVDAILALARDSKASDVHLLPADGGRSLQMLWRIDGVLHDVYRFDHAVSNIVSRLKVLAQLLTYQSDVPQEGRVRTDDESVEMRVSTFPTIHGEKAVVRMFIGSGRYRALDDLGLPADVLAEFRRLLTLTNGAILVSGPAGSGKTTTLYACLREIMGGAELARSICTLEDPVEAVIPGVSQSQIRESAGFDYATGLRSLMRQDPDVIMVGEIRDRGTAATVFQAALTGQLVLSSFHAGSTSEAVERLFDLGIEPYLLRSSLMGVLSQRLLRRLCRCAVSGEGDEDRLGLKVGTFRVSAGCQECHETGYAGRVLLTEFLDPQTPEFGRAIADRAAAQALERAASDEGMATLTRRACEMVEAGLTSPAEVRRVLGPERNSTTAGS
ncbi:MAG: type II/IV secretion system protein [Planctomycetota bacterium]|nr:MAG: type II/IV secretion system protein [Planctomycetota bacterium]REJ98497.1 MAG: type II/IV secretion system protein [Planctomycetota bacterium]REK23589.1 MAG: type II/IV secretion system protein [Planctomycetota bacterium]REK31187.1 MAG: type II/IV secretion system protein [Planctomycetota bacterium]